MPRTLPFWVFCAFMLWTVSARGEEETLSEGIAAYKAGRIDSALQLLAHEESNPYLEAIRLLYRAQSLSRASRRGEAASDLEHLLALSQNGAIVPAHPVLTLARETYLDIALQGDSCFDERDIPFDVQKLSAHASLILARNRFACGAPGGALEYLVRAARARPIPPDSILYREVMLRCAPLYGDAPRDSLLPIAAAAAALRLYHEAGRLIELLTERDTTDCAVLLSRADLYSRSGKPERALHAYWRIFYSAAPVETKQDALDRIAGIEYRLKHYNKAYEYYRMFGVFYPRDRRAVAALDLAARIAVLEGQWGRALELWSVVRERGGRDKISSEAWLSEGVLRYWRGDREGANKILRDLLAQTDETMAPSVLYWLARTSSSAAQKTLWSDSLSRAYQRSSYTRIMREEAQFLNVGKESGAGADIRAVERFEGNLCDSLSRFTAPDDSLLNHPAYAAFVYFLDRDLLEEAEETALALAADVNLTDGGHFELYRRGISKGLPDISFRTLWGSSGAEGTARFPWELWYPVLYSEMIEGQAAAHGIPADLLLAIIREESRYDAQAVSRDGARGLMQLLPSTASWVAAAMDSIEFSPDDLFEPAVSVALGARYFTYLINRFKGSIICALAAYNAGEGRVTAWNRNFDPVTSPAIALEMIGPRETRLYVKRVLDSVSAYRFIGEEKARLK